MYTILVADDEKRIRNVYKGVLKQRGYKVVDVPNIIDARKYIKAVKVDLVLLDINMGELSGDILYEVSKCFHQNIKIIVSSVYSVEDQKRLMPHADDYFDKSEGNKVLLEKISGVLLNSSKCKDIKEARL